LGAATTVVQATPQAQAPTSGASGGGTWPPPLAAVAAAVERGRRALSSPTVARILSPPIVGCITGLFVGTCAPVRGVLAAQGAPLGFLWNSLRVLAAAYTPCGILVLAGSLANGEPQNMWTRSTAKKVGGRYGVTKFEARACVLSSIACAGLLSLHCAGHCAIPTVRLFTWPLFCHATNCYADGSRQPVAVAAYAGGNCCHAVGRPAPESNSAGSGTPLCAHDGGELASVSVASCQLGGNHMREVSRKRKPLVTR
jgi:hypothetical protein